MLWSDYKSIVFYNNKNISLCQEKSLSVIINWIMWCAKVLMGNNIVIIWQKVQKKRFYIPPAGSGILSQARKPSIRPGTLDEFCE